ncbi:hypothetical protein [Pantoea sp. F_18]|nr:hypothetical protein [Pantoea sp. F_18]
MEIKKEVVTSVSADFRLIEEKINHLLEVFPEHFSDEFFSVISGLLNNVIFVNHSLTVCAGGSFDVVCIFDFDTTAYDEVMAAARALKVNLTHK